MELFTQSLRNGPMFNLNETMRYFLCPGMTDMRKGISSLCGVVHEKIIESPASQYHCLLWNNNLAENAIRPITPGKKNYLFCGNHEAAVNMSVVCSLPTTCKAHDVTPREYLNDVIARIPYQKKANSEELSELLPHKWKLQHPGRVSAMQNAKSGN